MKDSLKEKLLEQIKTNGRMTHRDMVLFCLDNSYKPDNGTRRLREVRDPKHPDFDSSIQVEMNGGTIMAYTYKPNSAPQPTVKPSTDTCSGDHKCWHYRMFHYCKCVPEPKQEVKQTQSLF